MAIGAEENGDESEVDIRQSEFKNKQMLRKVQCPQGNVVMLYMGGKTDDSCQSEYTVIQLRFGLRLQRELIHHELVYVMADNQPFLARWVKNINLRQFFF